MPPPLRARVIGAGPTGSLSALALVAAGWQVQLEDPLSTAQLCERCRAYAFNHSSRRLLQRLGLWQAVSPLLVPFNTLALIDNGVERSLRFASSDHAPDAALPVPQDDDGQQPIGWIGRHGPLMTLLLERLRHEPNVQVLLGDSNGAAPGQPPRPPAFDLVIAADGPASATRAALGIRSWGWDYRQHCLTAEIELRGAPPDRAWEVFRPEGPMAVLPLGEGLAQLVWSAPASRCREREALDPAAFLDRLSGVLPPPLEPDGLRDRPKAFPVGLRLASRLSRGRTLLVGESAHRCHPVGGQGLNLCWRDVAELHRLACRATAGRLAPERIGAAYSLRRLPDLLLVLLEIGRAHV